MRRLPMVLSTEEYNKLPDVAYRTLFNPDPVFLEPVEGEPTVAQDLDAEPTLQQVIDEHLDAGRLDIVAQLGKHLC